MCRMCEQETAPAAVIERQLGIINGLALRDEAVRQTLDSAISAIQEQVSRLVADGKDAEERATRSNRRASEARTARMKAETVASNTKVMATLVRDLTKLFPGEELEFEQTDENGYAFRVTGYDALFLSIDLYAYMVTVRNTTTHRKERTYSFDPSVGLTGEVYLAIEALFKGIELSKGNTPRRVHDELFEDESDEGPRVTFGVMASPDCGESNCPLHGDNGLLRNASEVPDVVRRIAEALVGRSVQFVPAGMDFGGFANMV